MPCSPATAATETPGVRQVAKRVALNSGEYLRWVRRVEYLWFSEVLSIVSTIKFVDTILQDPAANLNMTLLDAYGTTLLRDFAGQQYKVTVLPDGLYEFDGKNYKSLSAIAKLITGTQWSGPAFFGLKGKKS
jgi:hypothetical protein